MKGIGRAQVSYRRQRGYDAVDGSSKCVNSQGSNDSFVLIYLDS